MSPGRAGGRWAAAQHREQAGRREVMLVASGAGEVYARLDVPEPQRSDAGLVVCGPWGVDGDRHRALVRGLVAGVLRLGVATVVFDPPGHGDSTGTVDDVTLDSLTQAAIDIGAQASVRLPGRRWLLTGVDLGGAVAALAADRLGDGPILLLRPAPDPVAWVEDLRVRARRARLLAGREDDGSAFGHPLPERLDAPGAAAAVQAAVRRHAGRITVIRYAGEPSPALPPGVATIEVPGRRPLTAPAQPALVEAAVRCLADRIAQPGPASS